MTALKVHRDIRSFKKYAHLSLCSAAKIVFFEKLHEGLSFFPKDNFYGHLVKAEIFTDLIDQITLVRKMDALDIADKENKGGRLDTYLRCIRNMLFPALKAGQGIVL